MFKQSMYLAIIIGLSAPSWGDDGGTWSKGATPSHDRDVGDVASKALELKIDNENISVSGVSSGAYMAAQLAVAFSETYMGAGLVAGGPYFCAQNLPPSEIDKIKFMCMNGGVIPDDIAPYVNETDARAADGSIDPTSNIAKQKIFIFNSLTDQIINPGLGYLSKLYFDHYGADVAAYNALVELDVDYVNYAVAHGMPTQNPAFVNFYDQTDRLFPCSPANSQLSPWFPIQFERGNDPWLYHCPYPNEDEILEDGFSMFTYIMEHIYGPGREAKKPKGELQQIEQLQFAPQFKSVDELHAHGIGEYAYLYVPTACSSGETCKLHVALHGCQQFPEWEFTYKAGSAHPGETRKFGDLFYDGLFNPIADSFDAVVLYPQAYNIGTSQSDINPYGCWEFWGFFDDDVKNYYLKSGNQMSMIQNMVNHFANGARPGQ